MEEGRRSDGDLHDDDDGFFYETPDSVDNVSFTPPPVRSRSYHCPSPGYLHRPPPPPPSAVVGSRPYHCLSPEYFYPTPPPLPPLPPPPPPPVVRGRPYQCLPPGYFHPPPPPPPPVREEDQISRLEDAVLVRILSFLPLINAISTAILSKRWAFLWKKVPNLTFHDFTPFQERRTFDSDIVSFIDRFLLLHEGSIDKFSIEFFYSPEYMSSVDLWLQVATARNVQEINLDFHDSGECNVYVLPQRMYSNSSLVKLALSCCGMNPNAWVSWPSLKSLSISDGDSRLNDNLINIILSGCPALESLELHRCKNIRKLDIVSPNLKTLVVSDCGVERISVPKVESLSILEIAKGDGLSLNLPSLVRANLDFQLVEVTGFEASYQNSERLVTNLLETMRRAKELTVGNWIIQVLSAMEAQGLITSPLFTCKYLMLNTKSSDRDILGIASLLTRSVSLETLVINMKCLGAWLMKPEYRNLDERLGKINGKNFWNSEERGLVNSMQCLKTVRVIDDHYMPPEKIEPVIGLLQFILENARALETVFIHTNKSSNFGPLNSMQATKRLLSFSRASPSAVILYQPI